MIPILQKQDKMFVETLPKVFKKIVKTFWNACIKATIAKAKIVNLETALTPQEFENMVNDDIMIEAIDSLIVEESKNVIQVLQKRLFLREKVGYSGKDEKEKMEMVPWVVGCITVLGFDDSEQKTIAEWVKKRVVDKFKETSRHDKDKLFNYKVLELCHDQKILRPRGPCKNIDDIVSNSDEEEQDNDMENFAISFNLNS